MIIRLCFIFFITISSCNFKTTSLTGIYKSYKPIFSSDKYTIGVVLKLNDDSTFNYQTCGDISSGKWVVSEKFDSVILYCYKFKYINDSLNSIKNPVCKQNEVFQSFEIYNRNTLKNKFKDIIILLKRQ